MKVKHGSKRIVRRFLFLPKTLDVRYSLGRWLGGCDGTGTFSKYVEAKWGKETRWLEWVWIEQIRGSFGWHNYRFIDVKESENKEKTK